MPAIVALEPEFVSDKTAAAVLAISPRAFAHVVRRGELAPVRVPGMRRVVYALADVRGLAAKWRAISCPTK